MVKKYTLSFLVMVSLIFVCSSLLRAETAIKSQKLSGEKVIRVELSVAEGQIILSSGKEDEAFYARVDYTSRYKVRISYVKRGDEGFLKIKVKQRKGSFFGGRKRVRTVVRLPPSVPISLESSFGAGKARMNLSKLRLSDFSLSIGAGDTDVYFGTSNPEVMDLFQLEVGVGSINVRKLGNANCRRLEVNGGVGSITLDFSGKWQRDIFASIAGGIGGIHLIFPRELGVELDASGFGAKKLSSAGFSRVSSGRYVSDNLATAKYRLKGEVEIGLGGIRVKWIK